RARHVAACSWPLSLALTALPVALVLCLNSSSPPLPRPGHASGQGAALNVGATMSHEVCFQKAGLGFLPLLERADGNLLFEQRSCSRRRKAAQRQCALGPEKAIRRCCAHGKQLPSALFRNVEMFMALKRFNECGEKGDEAF